MPEALHYYPGHFHKASDIISGTVDTRGGGGLLVFIRDGKIIYKSEAWGGLSKKYADPLGGVDYTPTPSGNFVLDTPAAYRTKSWLMSEIKWGTPIKDVPSERNLKEENKTDVWYRLPNGKWASVFKDFGIPRVTIIEFHNDLYHTRKLPSTWVFNAFGPIAIRFFKDLNGNKKRDKNEPLDGSMFHTTAENEAELKQGNTITMGNSHGCIHMNPSDRNQLTALKAFRGGMDLIIHPYNKKFTTK